MHDSLKVLRVTLPRLWDDLTENRIKSRMGMRHLCVVRHEEAVLRELSYNGWINPS